MTKRKKKNNKRVYIIIAVLLLFLLALGGIRVILNGRVRIDSRVEELSDYKKNKIDYETIGWLKIPGTNIDYPIIENLDFLDGELADKIDFLWATGDLKTLHRINYIMGHNIMNLSKNPVITDKNHVRFEQLMSYTYLEFAQENQYIQFTIDGKDYLFKIFAVGYPESDNTPTVNLRNYDSDNVDYIIKKLKKESIYKYDVDVNKEDTILSLVTCTRMFDTNNNFQVSARLVRENETTKKYKVEKTKNYDVVEEIMKGGETTNEEL